MTTKSTPDPATAPLVTVVGDDLSGVISVSGELASWGFATVVLREPGELPVDFLSSADATSSYVGTAVAVTTDSRHDSPVVAREKVLAATKTLADDGSTVLVKKVDSLLRGNVAPELAAAMTGMGASKALCIFAAPSQGRTTVGGEQLVDGEPVGGHDPGSYLRSGSRGASVTNLLREEFGDRVCPVGLDVVESGREQLQSRLKGLLAENANAVVVCDATKTSHIADCVGAGLSAGFRLLVGTSDLCGTLAEALISRGTTPPPLPVLLVSGTASRPGSLQVERAVAQGAVRPVEVFVASVEAGQYADRAVELLSAGENVLLCPGDPRPTGQDEATPKVARMLALVAAGTLRKARVCGVVATGGETAQAVLDLLDTRALAVGRDVIPGVPEAVALDGPHAGLRFVAKTGAYGGPDALEEIAGWLRSSNELFDASVGMDRVVRLREERED